MVKTNRRKYSKRSYKRNSKKRKRSYQNNNRGGSFIMTQIPTIILGLMDVGAIIFLSMYESGPSVSQPAVAQAPGQQVMAVGQVQAPGQPAMAVGQAQAPGQPRTRSGFRKEACEAEKKALEEEKKKLEKEIKEKEMEIRVKKKEIFRPERDEQKREIQVEIDELRQEITAAVESTAVDKAAALKLKIEQARANAAMAAAALKVSSSVRGQGGGATATRPALTATDGTALTTTDGPALTAPATDKAASTENPAPATGLSVHLGQSAVVAASGNLDSIKAEIKDLEKKKKEIKLKTDKEEELEEESPELLVLKTALDELKEKLKEVEKKLAVKKLECDRIKEKPFFFGRTKGDKESSGFDSEVMRIKIALYGILKDCSGKQGCGEINILDLIKGLFVEEKYKGKEKEILQAFNDLVVGDSIFKGNVILVLPVITGKEGLYKIKDKEKLFKLLGALKGIKDGWKKFKGLISRSPGGDSENAPASSTESQTLEAVLSTHVASAENTLLMEPNF